MWKIVTWL